MPRRNRRLGLRVRPTWRYTGPMYTEDWYGEAGSEQRTTVLVVIVPRLADWQHIVAEGWYHIPLAKAPARIAVDRLAFYHPGCFGQTRHTISYYADVRGYDLCPRRELFPQQSDHPRADALYYRLRLGPVEPLPWPIHAARLRRVTFIRTTWELLLQAEDITDLWQRESLPLRLARELQERHALYAPVAA